MKKKALYQKKMEMSFILDAQFFRIQIAEDKVDVY